LLQFKRIAPPREGAGRPAPIVAGKTGLFANIFAAGAAPKGPIFCSANFSSAIFTTAIFRVFTTAIAGLFRKTRALCLTLGKA